MRDERKIQVNLLKQIKSLEFKKKKMELEHKKEMDEILKKNGY